MEILTGPWAVTGAAGTIGRNLRRYLVDQGVPLVSMDIVATDSLGSSDTVVRSDLRDQEATEEALAGCVGVVHLGGLANEADFHDLTDANILGTYHVLEAARRQGLRRVVYASSNRITGFYPASTTVIADMPVRPDGFYGVSKAAAESLAQLYADKFGISAISIRIGTYGQSPADSRQASTWLSHPDALRAFTAAMTTERHHAVFYAVSRNRNRWWDLGAGEEIGYFPQDDAANLMTDATPVPPGQPQGGHYATAEYSLRKMKH